MRTVSLVAVLGTTTLVACSKDNAGSADSARLADSATAASAAATAPAATRWTDGNVFAVMDELNEIESAAGKLASTKGTSADVRTFGVTMANDHQALRKVGQDLATKLGVTPTPPPNDSIPMKGQVMADSLTSMPKGPQWDKQNIGKEVVVHQQVLDIVDSLTTAAQAPELKNMLTQARATIEAHLKRAQEIQGKLEKGGSS